MHEKQNGDAIVFFYCTSASESGIASDNRRLGHGDEHYFDEEEDFSRAESCFLQAVAVYSTELQVEEWIGNHRVCFFYSQSFPSVHPLVWETAIDLSVACL